MFIGDGAKLVRDAFALAKEKTPAIIFIDELDAIGTKVHNVLVYTGLKNTIKYNTTTVITFNISIFCRDLTVRRLETER